MKTWTILLTVGAVASVVAIPFVTAEEGCSRADDLVHGAYRHPTKENTYVFFDATQADKLGEWTESNGRSGLQTVNCLAATGSVRYAKDTQVEILG